MTAVVLGNFDHSKNPVDSVAHHAVQRAIDFMHENLGEEIDVGGIAAAANFSKFHFSRLFKRVTGLPPRAYLSNLRYHQATHHLLASDLSVTEITYKVGFQSVGSFSNSFRAVFGMSPAHFRKAYKDDPARWPGYLSALPTPGTGITRDRTYQPAAA